jgi:hypothetical protein
VTKYIQQINESKSKQKQETSKPRPLDTPSYVQGIEYVRCNCREGVPSNNRNYEPIPNPWKIGNIHVKHFERIIDEAG